VLTFEVSIIGVNSNGVIKLCNPDTCGVSKTVGADFVLPPVDSLSFILDAVKVFITFCLLSSAFVPDKISCL